MSSWLGKFHDFTGKYDPLGHGLVNLAHKSSTKLVNETHRGLEKAGEKVGIDNPWATYWKDQSQKDKDSFNRWGENTLGAAAAIYGGISALGGEGAAAAGGSGAGGGAGAGAGAGAGGYAEAGGGFVGNGEFLGNLGGYSEAGGGFVGNNEFLGNSGGGFNSKLAQMGARGLGNNSTQTADSGALQRQLALAEAMRRQRELEEAGGELPGWVNMQGVA